MSNIEEELKEFIKFKENYNFTQKEIVEKDGNFYCEGEILKDDKENKYSENDKWIDVGYRNRGNLCQLLSNLFPYEFKFKGKKLSSIESFFQGIKFKDKKVQDFVFKYYGTQAVHLKEATDYNWKETGILYWQGKGIKRDSKEYEMLVDELYISAIQNPLYRGAILNCTKPIIHSIGEENKEDTVFTRYEFEKELNCLKDFLKSRT